MSETVRETAERVLETAFTDEPTAAALAGRVFRERGDAALEELVDAAEAALGEPATDAIATDEVVA